MITPETTLTELFNLGFLKSSIIDSWNSKLAKQKIKQQRQEQVAELMTFISDNAEESLLYKTGNFLNDCLEEYPEYVDDVSGNDKRVKMHKLITTALKNLVSDGTMEVINKTGNHAHNRYGLKVDREALPEFATIKEISSAILETNDEYESNLIDEIDEAGK